MSKSIPAGWHSVTEVTTIRTPSEGFDDVYSTVQQYLSRTVPDAIVAATESMGVAALKACENLGVDVPKRVIVTGFNGFDLWRYTHPRERCSPCNGAYPRSALVESRWQWPCRTALDPEKAHCGHAYLRNSPAFVQA
jgi:hypothetical protein